MANQYDGVLQFKGKWRDYQERVLTNAQHYLADRKVHIVAAPGSGKTTLGIELIRRLGAPCLILSPSITIRQQWLSRITDGFLMPGNDPDKLLSNNLKAMKPITAITYQALYSAMKQEQGEVCGAEEEEDETVPAETVDFKDFRIFDAVKAAGVRTICLDEAHHLRSEWWKALEAFLKELSSVTVIALTATPPYDSTPAQWKRYIDLCGPIDEEIFTPELVREGSLCPHEDYVYLNWPAKEELAEIQKQQETVAQFRNRLLSDPSFTQMIASHQGLLYPESYSEQFLDHPAYFSALLIFCQAQQIDYSPYLKELIGTKGRLPDLSDEWLEILLQGFFYDDADSYSVEEAKREALLKEAKAAGCVYRRQITLTKKETMEKLLAKSSGKLSSIQTIVRMEHQSLGDTMRMLILCDYIKKDVLPLVGTEREMKAEIGAVPIFESLRRLQMEGIRLACVSGSVVLLPMDTQQTIQTLLAMRGSEGTLVPVKETGYGELQVKGTSTHVVEAVTELFRLGEVNTMIGTKSLLGEGWDAPFVNALILSTYVGSFMLSNQMRGRTIRTDRTNPKKTGNIWHLACVFPKRSGQTKHVDLTGDYQTLCRRFDAFLGVSATEPVIESGIGRLAIPAFDTREEMERINQTMLLRASDRDALRARWQNAFTEIHGGMEVEQVEAVPKEDVQTGYVFVHALGMEILCVVLAVLFALGRLLMTGGHAVSFLLGVGLLAAAFFAGKYGVKLFRFSTPERRMKRISEAMRLALIEIGALDDPAHCKVEVESVEGVLIGTWLKGASMRDKTTFACCMEELWGIIDNPRYLLMRVKKHTDEYYSVPECFGRQKERALVFEKQMRKVLGNYRVVYTRTPEGRRILLRARTKSFVNKNQRALLSKKVAKGKYE